MIGLSNDIGMNFIDVLAQAYHSQSEYKIDGMLFFFFFFFFFFNIRKDQRLIFCAEILQ